MSTCYAGVQDHCHKATAIVTCVFEDCGRQCCEEHYSVCESCNRTFCADHYVAPFDLSLCPYCCPVHLEGSEQYQALLHDIRLRIVGLRSRLRPWALSKALQEIEQAILTGKCKWRGE